MADLNLGDLKLSSPAFGHGEPIPDPHSHGGGDRIPELRWSHVPEGTRELALVVHDPDAPLVDGFTHWVVLGMPPESTGIGGELDPSHVCGINSVGDAAYMGPAPPPGHGTHHYFFHLFALDEPVGTTPLPDRDSLLEQVDGHIIEQARLVGTYRTD